jgi:hypothetical protein
MMTDTFVRRFDRCRSFFFAYPTPMMRALIDATSQLGSNPPLVPGLSMIANVVSQMLRNNLNDFNKEMQLVMLCVMTGCIILVDHLDTNGGAFHRASPIRSVHELL